MASPRVDVYVRSKQSCCASVSSKPGQVSKRSLYSPDGTIINCQVKGENDLVPGHQRMQKPKWSKGKNLVYEAYPF